MQSGCSLGPVKLQRSYQSALILSNHSLQDSMQLCPELCLAVYS